MYLLHCYGIFLSTKDKSQHTMSTCTAGTILLNYLSPDKFFCEAKSLLIWYSILFSESERIRLATQTRTQDAFMIGKNSEGVSLLVKSSIFSIQALRDYSEPLPIVLCMPKLPKSCLFASCCCCSQKPLPIVILRK